MVSLNTRTVNVGETIIKTLGEGDNLRYQIIQKRGKDVATRTLDYLGNVIKDTLELNGHKVGNKTVDMVKVVEGENTAITEKIYNELSEYLGQRISNIKGSKKTVKKMNANNDGFYKEFENGMVLKKGRIRDGYFEPLVGDYGTLEHIHYNNKGLPIPTETYNDLEDKTVFDNMSLQEILKFAKDNWKGYFEGKFYPKHSGLEKIKIDYSKFNPEEYAKNINLFA